MTLPASVPPPAPDSSPEAAAALGIVPAATGIRSLAFAIDAAIWLLLASPAVIGAVMIALGDTSFVGPLLIVIGAALPLLFGLLQLVLHGRRGVTAGKAAMRLRSIDVDDFGRVGFWRVVLRILVLWASGIVPLVGPALMFASGVWDPQDRGRSILDRVGRCWVIDARAGLDPFDAKALRHARRAAAGRPDQSEELPSMASDADAAVALRIPGARSRAGVVGPGSTGAQWEGPADGVDASVIAQVPGGAATAHAATGLVTGAPGISAAAPAPAAPAAAPAHAPAPAPAHAPAPATPAAQPPAAAPMPAPAQPVPAAAPPAAAPLSASASGATAAAAGPAPVVQSSPGTGPSPVGSRRAQAMIRFDDGSIVRVPGRGLIGRDPEPAQGEQVEALVRLEDPQRLMSKTHAAFGQDADGLWVVDRGSRNGTQLVSPGGDVVDVPADQAARVPLGWSVQVGGRSFELVARGADS
ncbi:RDD family protein [Microbacterium hibisci]|uniref:RDD family protein n=1 Tax=Microbacterium hibisci TaxID=2036000 RepID=UPI001943F3EE|nr:RDD family protein [Microbacterium hibisci]